MALDSIAEVVLKAVGQFLIEVVLVGVFYWPGWLILRTLTFGRYPPKRPHPHSEEFVGAFGFAAILVGALLTVSGGGL
ncbi:hypothetical protein [Noviherbaspirillum sp.]|uniref:hypothetical protein n=1 Tax=Noviherbaspirillum sp. TaxID=1926288 RepID=UPI002FE23C78